MSIRIRFSAVVSTAFLGFVASSAMLVSTTAWGQGIPGPSVNIIGPTPNAKKAPGSAHSYMLPDTGLKQQNEVNCAVRPDNPLIAFCGYNDYRTTEISSSNDAWIGVSMTRDGGLTWTSRLAPGWAEGYGPLGLDFAADPIVEAVPGLAVVNFIAADRSGKGDGGLYLQHWFESDKENGFPYQPARNSILITKGTSCPQCSGRFIDKPHMITHLSESANTVPVSGTLEELDEDGAFVTKDVKVPAGELHVVYSVFTGKKQKDSQIMHTRSLDYGQTWEGESKLSESVGINQSAFLVANGKEVFVVWRRFSDTNEDNALMYSLSTDSGQTWASPEVLQTLECPYDQPTANNMFRTTVHPVAATDGDNYYVFWSERGRDGYLLDGTPTGEANNCQFGLARIVMKTLKKGDVGNWLNAPVQPIDADTIDGNFGKGYQFMPSVAVANGVVQVAWYDSRDSLFRGVNEGVMDVLFKEVPGNPSPIGKHTIDVRGKQIEGGDLGNPSVKISTYPMLQIGDTQVQLGYNFANARMFSGGKVPFIGDYVSVAARTSRYDTEDNLWRNNQKGVPGLDPEVFYTAWTDNRDTRGDRWGNLGSAGTSYSAPQAPIAIPPKSTLDSEPGFDSTTGRLECAVNRDRTRDQNVYATTIKPGAVLNLPTASKKLGALQRGYVVNVENTNRRDNQTFTLCIGAQPKDYVEFEYYEAPTINSDGSLNLDTGNYATGLASFEQYPAPIDGFGLGWLLEPVDTLTITVPPQSSSPQSVYVTSKNYEFPHITVTAHEGNTCEGTLVSSVIINGDRPEIDLSAVVEDPNADPTATCVMDGETRTCTVEEGELDPLANLEVHTPQIINYIWALYTVNGVVPEGQDEFSYASEINPLIMTRDDYGNPLIMTRDITNPLIMTRDDTANPLIMTRDSTTNPLIMTRDDATNPLIMTEDDYDNPLIMTKDDSTNPLIMTREGGETNPLVMTRDGEVENPLIMTYGSDIDNPLIMTKDAYGDPLIMTRDSEGGLNPLIMTAENVDNPLIMTRDAEGNPLIMTRDADGVLNPAIDTNGELVTYLDLINPLIMTRDADGVLNPLIMTDSSRVTYDEYGNPLVMTDGALYGVLNPLIMTRDANGNPLIMTADKIDGLGTPLIMTAGKGVAIPVTTIDGEPTFVDGTPVGYVEVTWLVENEGNTITAYNAIPEVVGELKNSLGGALVFQLIVSRPYLTYASRGCEIGMLVQNQIIHNRVYKSFEDGPGNWLLDSGNATFLAAPGEETTITLRIFDPEFNPKRLGFAVQSLSCNSDDLQCDKSGTVEDAITIDMATRLAPVFSPRTPENNVDAGPDGTATVTWTADTLDPTVTAGMTCDSTNGATITTVDGLNFSGEFFIGTSIVTCKATDETEGVVDRATATNTFKVVLVDVTPPVFPEIEPVYDSEAVVNTVDDGAGQTTEVIGAVVNFPTSATDLGEELTPVCTRLDNDESTADAPVEVVTGEVFPLGDWTVTCVATDPSGNETTQTFDVSVKDTTAPVVTIPNDTTLEADSAAGTRWFFRATATDIVSGDLDATCTMPGANGSTIDLSMDDDEEFTLDDGEFFGDFPIGENSAVTTTVTCSATDAATNKGEKTFTVTVQDMTSPKLLGLVFDASNTQPIEATGPQTTVAFTVSVTDAVDADPVIVCAPESGSGFVLGITQVSCTATDKYGNVGKTEAGDIVFQVNVVDNTPPVLTLPASVNTTTLGTTADVTIKPSAFDLHDGDRSSGIKCSIGSEVGPDNTFKPGDEVTFAYGTSTVTCAVSDSSGNTSSGSFLVTVSDAAAPTISVPSQALVVEATGSTGASVSFNVSASDNIATNMAVTCLDQNDVTRVSGETFALGDYTLTCSATDGDDNTGTGTFDVRVVDTKPPSLSLPSSPYKVTMFDPSGTAVDFGSEVSATDLVAGDLVPDCSPASGSLFAPGDTTVSCTANDGNGNFTEGSFTVQVHYGTFIGLGTSNGYLAEGDISRRKDKVGSSVPLYWQYGDANGQPVDSAAAASQLVIRGPHDCSATDQGMIRVEDPGSSDLRYTAADFMWKFNWQSGADSGGSGCYTVRIKSGLTGENHGPYVLQLR